MIAQLRTAMVEGSVLSTLSAIGGFSLSTLRGWIQVSHGALDTFSRRLDWLSMDVSSILRWIVGWFSIKPSPYQHECHCLMVHFEYWTTCTNYLGWVVIVAHLWTLESTILSFW